MTTFFGERWDAPIVDDAEQVSTPVGERCYDCTELIADGDRGFVRGMVRMDADGQPTGAVGYVHAECDLRGTCGHLVGLCRCTGYPSTRATARLVWARYFGGRS